VIALPPQLAVALVGGPPPGWVRGLPAGLAEVAAISRSPLEAGLNQALERTGAPFFLPVQANDRLEPTGVAALLDALRASPLAIGATAAADQVRRGGGLRRTPPAAVAGGSALLALRRLPTPVLFRSAALQQAGGWREGEAAWHLRPWRHRGLLLRLLEGGGRLIATDAYLGEVALPGPDGPDEIRDVLEQLLYHRVTVTGDGLQETGRIAAVTPELLTLAAADEQVTLVPVARISAVRPLAEPGEPQIPQVFTGPGGRFNHQPAPGGRSVTQVWRKTEPGWPSPPS
jgi:hypothetical protein